MAKQLSIPDIIDLWPRQEDLAEDCGVERVAVSKWKKRGRVPASHFAAILSSAKTRGLELTAETLAAASAAPPKKRDLSVKQSVSQDVAE